MSVLLATLNQARNGLKFAGTRLLRASGKPLTAEGHVHPGEQLLLPVAVWNDMGGGGSSCAWQGYATFKDIQIIVRGSDYATVLDGKDGDPMSGDMLAVPLTGVVLKAGETAIACVWLKVRKEASCLSPEQVATVLVKGKFDISECFGSGISWDL